MAADNALNHAFMAVMVTAGAIAVALTGCKEQGQVLRVAGLKKTLLESLGKGLRASTGYETAGSNGIAVLNLQVSGQNLPAFNLYKKTGFRITETLSRYLY